ncbi:MAG TPA: DUF302 domain-containing protein [Acidiferrobacteraceae bacterium]|nr:DUF302 domain-containing protein [Acidiferrobacteraceae bacterium]
MSIDEQDPYALTRKLVEPFAAAVDRLRQAVAAEQLQLLYEANLDGPGRSCRVFGIADNALTQKALTVEPNIGVLLPLQMTLRADGSGTQLAFADPVTILAIANNPEVTLVAWEMRRRFEQVRDRLTAPAPSPVKG